MQLVAEVKNGVILRNPKGDINITKIKLKGESIKITYELPPESTETKIITFACSEQPRVEFYKAVTHVFKTAVNLCGLDSKTWETGDITDISIKQTEEGVDVAIALLLELEQGAVKLTYTQEDISHNLNDEIDNLLAEVEDYISGKRAQLSLDLGI